MKPSNLRVCYLTMQNVDSELEKESSLNCEWREREGKIYLCTVMLSLFVH